MYIRRHYPTEKSGGWERWNTITLIKVIGENRDVRNKSFCFFNQS